MTPEERTAISAMLGGDSASLAHELDEIEAVIGIYRSNKKNAASLPSRKTRKRDLTEYSEALALIATPTETVDAAFGDIREYARLLQVAQRLYPHVKQALEKDNKKAFKGPSPDDREWLLSRLSTIFTRCTGKAPTASWNEHLPGYSGPFYDFARALFTEGEFTNSALGKTIKRTRAVTKS